MHLCYFSLLAFIGMLVIVVWGHNECVRSRSSLSCPKKCIKFMTKRRCYSCKPGCNSGRALANNTCDPQDSSSCTAGKICLAEGPAGIPICIPKKLENVSCSETDSDTEDGTDGAEKLPDSVSSLFQRIKIRRLKKAHIPCIKGLFCKRISTSRHVCKKDRESACMLEKLVRPHVSCQKNGDYNPLQCTSRNGKQFCRCVSLNGTDIEGTEKEVNKKHRKPDCGNRKCSYRSARGSKLAISSHTLFVDSKKCRRCLCVAGESLHCITLNKSKCNRINELHRFKKECKMNNMKIKAGATIQIGCKKCACINGKLKCLRGRCKKGKTLGAEKDDKCLACSGPRRPVCGNDGKTYHSACIAMNCRGLSMNDFTLGACQKKDVCTRFGCNSNEMCVRRGGVTCLSRKGCSGSKHFRECVNLEKLLCRKGQNQTSSEVCGSDGVTYPSLCELLQSSVGVKVKYGGKCNDRRCSSGEVCGTDGVTYSNICELRAQSANARVDYHGKCVESSSDMPPQDKCQNKKLLKRCKKVSNCMTPVLPEDGCCPICGGGITVGFDRDAFEDYLALNPSVETVDDLLMRVILSGLISEKDLRHCEVKATLLDEGDLFMTFEAIVESEDYCMNLAKKIENMINNPSQIDSDSVAVAITPIPEEFQFAIVAQTSPLVSSQASPGATAATGSGKTCMKVVSFAGIIFTALMPIINTF